MWSMSSIRDLRGGRGILAAHSLSISSLSRSVIDFRAQISGTNFIEADVADVFWIRVAGIEVLVEKRCGVSARGSTTIVELSMARAWGVTVCAGRVADRNRRREILKMFTTLETPSDFIWLRGGA